MQSEGGIVRMKKKKKKDEILHYLCERDKLQSRWEGSEYPVDSQTPVISFFIHWIQTMGWSSPGKDKPMDIAKKGPFFQTKILSWQLDLSITALL